MYFVWYGVDVVSVGVYFGSVWCGGVCVVGYFGNWCVWFGYDYVYVFDFVVGCGWDGIFVLDCWSDGVVGVVGVGVICIIVVGVDWVCVGDWFVWFGCWLFFWFEEE